MPIETIKNIILSFKEWLLDSPTFIRWALILASIVVIFKFAGIEWEEFKVAILLFWYSTVSTVIAAFMSYVYGKVNYHKAKTDPVFIQAQVEIFKGVYLFSGLVILATYIAQFN